ncbi:MAG: hypothetical protein Q7J84_16445 [Sulfuricaulis sp.]|nr:hypothetical protein [Sulfuricaulis sp.]
MLDPTSPDYDDQEITALIEEVKPLLDRYNRANVINTKTAK